jgi:hypothetical protein
MESNKLITPESFPQFPPRMRRKTAHNPFNAANWSIQAGEIHLRDYEDAAL